MFSKLRDKVNYSTKKWKNDHLMGMGATDGRFVMRIGRLEKAGRLFEVDDLTAFNRAVEVLGEENIIPENCRRDFVEGGAVFEKIKGDIGEYDNGRLQVGLFILDPWKKRLKEFIICNRKVAGKYTNNEMFVYNHPRAFRRANRAAQFSRV